MAERDGYDKPPYKVDVEDFAGWCRCFIAFLMKYEGAYEAIQVVIPEVESVEETAVRLATHGKGNECAVSIALNTLQIKRAKTIDMRYYWLRDQVHQKKLKVNWKTGKLNLAYFFTKAHSVHHHLAIRWNMYCNKQARNK